MRVLMDCDEKLAFEFAQAFDLMSILAARVNELPEDIRLQVFDLIAEKSVVIQAKKEHERLRALP